MSKKSILDMVYDNTIEFGDNWISWDGEDSADRYSTDGSNKHTFKEIHIYRKNVCVHKLADKAIITRDEERYVCLSGHDDIVIVDMLTATIQIVEPKDTIYVSEDKAIIVIEAYEIATVSLINLKTGGMHKLKLDGHWEEEENRINVKFYGDITVIEVTQDELWVSTSIFDSAGKLLNKQNIGVKECVYQDDEVAYFIMYGPLTDKNIKDYRIGINNDRLSGYERIYGMYKNNKLATCISENVTFKYSAEELKKTVYDYNFGVFKAVENSMIEVEHRELKVIPLNLMLVGIDKLNSKCILVDNILNMESVHMSRNEVFNDCIVYLDTLGVDLVTIDIKKATEIRRRKIDYEEAQDIGSYYSYGIVSLEDEPELTELFNN